MQSSPPQYRGLIRGIATPAPLCHKEPAHRIQSPLLGAWERKIPLGRYFAYSSLVLYVIRAPIIGPFREWKPPIPYAIKNQRGASKLPS